MARKRWTVNSFRLLSIIVVLIMVTFCCGIARLSAAATISTANKYAWSENFGWLNLRPTGGEVIVATDHLSGSAWQENTGWLKLGSDGGGPYPNTTATNWGVNRDGAGTLSGYAWSEGWGWINFRPTGGGVNIDPVTGAFEGYAWGENIGWVSFQRPSGASVAYGVGLASYTLNLKFVGTGGGSVTSANPPFSCNTTCAKTFLEITPLTLKADAVQYSILSDWVGCDTITGATCSLNLDRDRTTTVTFTKDIAHTARIVKLPPAYYSTLQEAYNNASPGNTIQIWGLHLMETMICGNNTQVEFLGGYDQQYQNHTGTTTIRSLTIAKGMVRLDRIVIR